MNAQERLYRWRGRHMPDIHIGAVMSIAEFDKETNKIRLGQWRYRAFYEISKPDDINKTIALLNHEFIHWLLWQMEDWATCVAWDCAQGISGVWRALFLDKNFKVG